MNLPDPGASRTPDTSESSSAAAEPARAPHAPAGGEQGDDTLDLRLDGELADLLAEHERRRWLDAHGRGARDEDRAVRDQDRAVRDHDRHARHGGTASVSDLPGESPGPDTGPGPGPFPEGDLLDSVGDWPAAVTPVGTVRLVPVRMDRDLRLIAAWMNDPAVAAFWELAGPPEVTAAHLRTQLEGDGRSVPCLGLLDGVPMSYWEIYRADLDPIARHCRARPHDTGLHLLIGGVPDRGRGIGTALLRAVADLVLDRRSRCGRVLAEPDVRNVPSVAAFLSAGFRMAAEVELPGKRAALMVRDRALREAL